MGSDKTHDLPAIEGLRHVLIPAPDGDRWDHGELPRAVLNLDSQTVLESCDVLLKLAVVVDRALDRTRAARAVALREVVLELLPKNFDHPFCSVLRALAGLEQGTAGRRREQREEIAGRAFSPAGYPIHPRSVRRRVREDCWPWLLDRLVEKEVHARRNSEAGPSERLDRTVAVAPIFSSRWAADRLLASGVPAVGLDELDHIAAALVNARRHLDADVVAYLRDRVADCAASDGTRGPKETLPAALGIVGAVANAVHEVRPSVRPRLLAVGAQGAELVAWLYRDLGMRAAAESWRNQAIEWAREAGDRSMQTYVQLKRSQAAWDERDALSMLVLAQAVHEAPWPISPRVRAEAAQQEARAHAMLGGSLEPMARKLGEAQELLAADDPADLPEAEAQVSSHYGPTLLAMQTAICYCEAGQPGRAVDIYREQLTEDVFSARDYGYFLSLMAGALAIAGEPAEASDTAMRALPIALATSSIRTVDELVRVGARLEPWRHHPPVRELRDALVESGVAVSSW